MSVKKISIFISSRFSEFRDLRKALVERLNAFPFVPIHVVDMDDNGVDTEPPSAVCTDWVKRSELMILLVGDSYGFPVQGSTLSYTHLEYRAAIEEDAETRVLPFFIEQEPLQNISAPEDPQLASFKSEIQSNHRFGRYARPSTDEEWNDLLEIITGWVTKAIWEFQFRDSSQQDTTEWETGDDIAGISDAELTRLESLRPETVSDLGQALQLSADSTLDPAKQPKATAAAEQLREAKLAIQIGERGIAQRHLREAVSIRPLDPTANEWLARVLLTSGKLSVSKEAMRLAERAARIYEKTNQTLRSAACLILAARASGEYDAAQGISYARDAVGRAGWFAHAHLELARQLAQAGETEEVFQELRTAFRCHPAALDGVRNEPAFSLIRKELNAFINRIREETAEAAQRAYRSEARIATLLQTQARVDASWVTANRPSLLAFGCRASISRQLKAIQQYVYKCIDADFQSSLGEAQSNNYIVDAASLLITASRNIESIEPLTREGQIVNTGQAVFRYRQQGSERTYEWLAPVSMCITRICTPSKKHPLRGHAEVLRWAPVHREYSCKALMQQIQDTKATQDHAREAQAASESQYNHESMLFKAAIVTTAALLLSTHFLSTPFAAISLIIASTCGIKAFSLWRSFRKAKQDAISRNYQINGYIQQINTLEDQIRQLAGRTVTMRENLNQAISEFEFEALSLATVAIPFPWLPNARKGDWVVVSPRTLEYCIKNMGLSIALNDECISSSEDRTALFRVADRAANQIDLNRNAAYFPLAA